MTKSRNRILALNDFPILWFLLRGHLMNTLKKLIYSVFFARSTARKLEPCGFHHRVGGTLKAQIRWILPLFASRLITLMGKTLGSRFARNVCGSCVYVCVCLDWFVLAKQSIVASPKRIHPSLVCVLFGPSTIEYVWNTPEKRQRMRLSHLRCSGASFSQCKSRCLVGETHQRPARPTRSTPHS